MITPTHGLADDAVVIRHYLAIWDSYGTPPEHLLPDAEERVRAFLAEGRRERKLMAFVAEEGSRVAGSAACQVHLSPFPEVVRPENRLYGYIFHVWVEPESRRRGVARALVERCVDYLRGIGCTSIALHSSEAGMRVYEAVGFGRGPEMRLKLR